MAKVGAFCACAKPDVKSETVTQNGLKVTSDECRLCGGRLGEYITAAEPATSKYPARTLFQVVERPEGKGF